MSQEELNCIDIPRGLRIVNRNAKLYERLLKSFLTTTLYNELVEAVAGNDAPKAAASAHALKGVAANLALVTISDLIVPMEGEMKTGAVPIPSNEEMAKLAGAYTQTVIAIETLLANPELIAAHQ